MIALSLCYLFILVSGADDVEHVDDSADGVQRGVVCLADSHDCLGVVGGREVDDVHTLCGDGDTGHCDIHILLTNGANDHVEVHIVDNQLHTQLVVATNAEFAPWEYKEGTKYYGIDMEIAQLIANELNMELVIEDMDFDNVVGSVGKQGIDIAMSGITITAERLEAINFSTPYYTESIVIVCKADDTTFDSAGTVVDILTSICYPADAE